ncbi:hypothetical protein Golomagni_00838 [Golovinomyces magnicellulatus]|nr:hypothetical protein Golomagni_00838 [Golovinomyces magnicellulatus]
MASSLHPTSSESFSILYFASASSYTSKDVEHLPAPMPLSQLFDSLEKKYKGIKTITINLKYVDVPNELDDRSDTMIRVGDEVAIIPPVSAG